MRMRLSKIRYDTYIDNQILKYIKFVPAFVFPPVLMLNVDPEMMMMSGVVCV